jgi:hypothetical protein
MGELGFSPRPEFRRRGVSLGLSQFPKLPFYILERHF